ncbi:MAG: hypothetical protein SV253_07360 [Halobacteria archaeon]|nr:hypothetical protein [Halobacteria archaeon]
MSVSTTESDSYPDAVMRRLVDDPHFLETLSQTMSEGTEEPVQKAVERYMRYWD